MAESSTFLPWAHPVCAFDEDPCPGKPIGGLIDPVAEYNTADSLEQNNDGRAVVGGFVYRGFMTPQLEGRYVFGDFSRFTEAGVNNDGRLFHLNKKNVVQKNHIKTSKIQEFKLPNEIGGALRHRPTRRH